VTAGQFGSLYDSMRNTNNDHTLWLVTQAKIHERLTAYAAATMVESSAAFSGLELDAAKVSAIPPGFDYRAVSDLGNYSRLGVRWWNVQAGVRHLIGSRFLLDLGATYDDYRDRQPYIVDTTGKSWGIKLGANWIF
jgi:hypothetical protein